MVEIVKKAVEAIANHPAVLDVAVLAGFDWSDTFWTGPSVLVTTNSEPEVGREVARNLIDYAWETLPRKRSL